MKYLSIILFVFLASCYGKKPEKTGLEGTQIPSYNLLLSDSTTWISTSSISAGKPTAIFIFGPHCPHSKKQMKEIVDNMEDLKKIQFYIITPFPFQQMKEFAETYHLSGFSNVTVAQDTSNNFGGYYQARGVPFIALYSADRKLITAYAGTIKSETILQAVSE